MKLLKDLDIDFKEITYTNIKLSIVGQVDHGKTLLFESISGKSFIKYESGGITQTVYSFVKGNKVFFDTPGHENFSHMKKNVLNLCDMNLFVLSVMDAKTEFVDNMLTNLKALNKNFLILLSFCDRYTEEQILNKLSLLNIIPSYMGGEYEVFCLKYPRFTYKEFFSLQYMTVPEVENYIEEVSPILEKNTLTGEFGMFHMLNIAYIPKKGEISFGITNGGTVINKNDNILGTNIRITNLYHPNNLNFSIKKVSGFPHFFAFKTDKLLTETGITYFTHPKKHSFTNIDGINDQLQDIDKMPVLFVSKDIEKAKAIENALKDKKIQIYTNLGRIDKLTMFLIKEKKSKVLLYDCAEKENIQLLKEKGINYFASDNFYAILKQVEADYDLFLQREKREHLENIIKNCTLAENSWGFAKVLKIFKIKDKVIAGCILKKGIANLNYRATIMNKECVKDHNVQIVSLKITSKDVSSIIKKDEFGVVLNTSINIEEDDSIFFWNKNSQKEIEKNLF